MANVKHSGLTGTDLHEPKGVAAAGLGQAYISDNAGSGSWKQIATDEDATETTMEPKGISTASRFQVYQRGATAAGTWVDPDTLAERTYISISPTTADQVLAVGTAPVAFIGLYTSDISSSNIGYNDTTKEITYTGDQTIVVQLGYSLSGSTSAAATIKFYARKSTDGGSTYVDIPGAATERKFPLNDVGNIGATAIVSLDTDDKIQMWKDSDAAINLTVVESCINLLGGSS